MFSEILHRTNFTALTLLYVVFRRFLTLQNGVLSAVPHFVAIIYGFIFGFLADHIIGSGCLQKKNTRRLFHGLGFGVPAITSALLGYTTFSWVLCITVLSAGFGFRSAQYAGHYSLVYDIAPKFSGTVSVVGLKKTVHHATHCILF